jgi:hypothetical protein
MPIASLLRLSPEVKITLPNVDEALNIGYAIHSADDLAFRGKVAQSSGIGEDRGDHLSAEI